MRTQSSHKSLLVAMFTKGEKDINYIKNRKHIFDPCNKDSTKFYVGDINYINSRKMFQ